MKISYAITVCNEFVEIQKNGDEEVATWLTKQSKYPNFRFWRGLDFDNHFADWKNKLTEYCEGDYIFQIDADEIPNDILIESLPNILETNPDNEVYLVPRINTVLGLTNEHVSKWRWNVDKEGRVNWPDYQWRIWKNKSEIKWVNKVHEKLEGYKTYAALPALPALALYHPKTIGKQEKQNEYYSTL